MPIVSAKCPSCGANLKIDNSKDAAICEYCGNAFVVEKAINYYISNVNNTITANTVNIVDNSVPAFDIRGGVLVKYNGNETTVVVPDNVVEISETAFLNSPCVKSISIPKNVKKIGKLLNLIPNINTVNIPEGLLFIYYVRSVKLIELPDKIKIVNGMSRAMLISLLNEKQKKLDESNREKSFQFESVYKKDKIGNIYYLYRICPCCNSPLSLNGRCKKCNISKAERSSRWSDIQKQGYNKWVKNKTVFNIGMLILLTAIWAFIWLCAFSYFGIEFNLITHLSDEVIIVFLVLGFLIGEAIIILTRYIYFKIKYEMK